MSARRHHPAPPEVCPVCGEDVPPHAVACPGCGADHRSGWDEDSTFYDGIDLPDDAFDDEDTPVSHRRKLSPRIWSLAAVLLLLLLAWAMLSGRW